MKLDNRLFILGSGLLVASTFVWYVPALRGQFIWDDESYVARNRTLDDLNGLRRIWFEPGSTPQYYPLVFTSFWIERRIFGNEPLGYHVVNVGLHALNAVLLWRLLQRMRVGGAAFAAAVFALHPVHVESVAWITERKNVLSAAFYLAAGLAYLRHREVGDFDSLDAVATASDQRSSRWVVASLALFVCALLSKSATCTFPAAMVVVLWWKTGRIRGRDVTALSPMLLLGVLAGLWTAWVERRYVGAEGAAWELPLVGRGLLAGRILCFYFGKLLWPDPLMFIYPRWTIDASDLWQYAYPLTCGAGICGLWFARKRIGRGPSAAALLFVGTLFPALGFFDVYFMQFSYVADHFPYLASLAVIAALAAGLSRLSRFRALPVLQVMVLLILGVRTWAQATTYVSPRVLWEDTVTQNPGAWIAHNNWALLLERDGDADDAEMHYRTALSLKPDVPRVHSNLGGLLAERGEFGEAMDHLAEAVRLAPLFFDARFNLANAYARQGEWGSAVEHYRAALRLRPGDANANFGLGAALAQLGDEEEAKAAARRALIADPDHAGAQRLLDEIRGSSGR